MIGGIVKHDTINGVELQIVETPRGYVIEAAGREVCSPTRDMDGLRCMWGVAAAMCSRDPETVKRVAKEEWKP